MIQQELVLSSPVPTSDFSDIEDCFKNEYGAIRSCLVRRFYTIGTINLKEVVELFKEWKNEHEYIILRGEQTNVQSCIDLTDSHVSYDYIYRFVKASKRGNDVYRYLVSKKLKKLNELKNIPQFNENWGIKKTNVLFVTLTYDTNRCDVKTAWENIGDEYHLFCNNLRKQYGHIEIFRTWESTENNYPHVHAMIVFKDILFDVFSYVNKKGKKIFIVSKKENKKISGYWHSYVDIQGVENTQGATKELTKYITKDLCSEKGDKTNAMIWLFRKQSYAISKGFAESIGGTDGKNLNLSEPTNAEFINEMCNCNSPVVNWEFIGLLKGAQLKISENIWVADVKKPPPKVIELIERERIRWQEFHGKSW